MFYWSEKLWNCSLKIRRLSKIISNPTYCCCWWLSILCPRSSRLSLKSAVCAGGTPLNNPPIEIHTNSSMFALIFWPHVTIFCIFWLHECLKWRLEFNSKSLFWCQSRQIFEVRAIEERHHEFQLIHMPLHQFWPRYYSDGLSPVHVRFDFFSKQICNVEVLICHFYKNIKTLTQIHFPRDAHIFRTCTIFLPALQGVAPNAEGFSVVRPALAESCELQFVYIGPNHFLVKNLLRRI